jgi:ubiquinone biosynthesis monooxygenase Coq7
MSTRNYTVADRAIHHLDQALRTLWGRPTTTGRATPGAVLPEPALSPQQQHLAAGLMRINHAGEVSAQALYQGQALTAKLPQVRHEMEQAAIEENDHLAWCEQRLEQLGSRRSLLNPLWYLGSLSIGALAGVAGDKWSLGFVAETEHQVIRHLDEHLARLPAADDKSRAILEQMSVDEAHHATVALQAGGAELPAPIKRLMGAVSKVMTRTSYWI